MVNAWKMGVGSGSMLLGVYFFFNDGSLIEVVLAVILIAIGIGLIASDK